MCGQAPPSPRPSPQAESGLPFSGLPQPLSLLTMAALPLCVHGGLFFHYDLWEDGGWRGGCLGCSVALGTVPEELLCVTC